MTAVIIPAYNEAEVIEQSLLALVGQVTSEDEIIIVCNGCKDDTALIARKFLPRVVVLETEIPSKTNALNLGDQQAKTFPRVYLDADVVLSEGSLAKIVEILKSGRWLAASPNPVMNMDGVSWAVRAYYDIWLSLPYCRNGMIGAGVYALSEDGRKRFDDFPDLIADDGYVRALFKEAERGRVIEAKSIVYAPVNLRSLIKIKTRSRLGGIELAIRYPELLENEEKNYHGALIEVLRCPSKWLKFAVYLYVNAVSRFLAKRRMKNLAQYQWQKDVSSRQRKLGCLNKNIVKH